MASSTLKNWVIVNPSSGASGSTAVAISANKYYGRLARTAVTLQVDADELTGHSSADTTFTVTQAGYGNYMVLDKVDLAIPKTGGSIAISGTCNWEKMYVVSISGDTSYIKDWGSSTIPSMQLVINHGTAQSQGAIDADPGYNSTYSFIITSIDILANSTIADKTLKIILGNNSSVSTSTATAEIRVTIAAGDPYVTLSTKSITIPADGTAQTLTIASNTNWSITE
jgi:hypothetical protein